MIDPKPFYLTLALIGVGAAGLHAPAAHADDDLARVILVDEEEDDDPFDDFLYEPELVLEHADEIGLTDAQRDALIDKVVDIQAEVTRMELKAARDYGRLISLLEAETIDRAEVMPLVDGLLDVENETKRRYLELLIDLHNELTPEQRAKLDEYRGDDDYDDDEDS